METAAPTVPASPLTAINKAGLVIAFLLGLTDLASMFQPTPDGQDGPPYAILLLDAGLGLLTVVLVVIAWRTLRRGPIRIAAGARIISALTAFPAFFVDVPASLKVLVGVFVLFTAACVAMMLSPARRARPVTDN
jgi:hypothetical protein